MTPNAPLLLKTLHHIEAHPEEWNQEIWLCDTTACFAGRAALLDGAEPIGRVDLLARPDDPQQHIYYFADDLRVVTVRDRARRILGLTKRQAGALFDSSNTLDDLRAEVYRLTGDYDKLAQHTEAAAVRSINGEEILPSAYADPELDLDEKHLRWGDLKAAILTWQDAESGDADLACMEPELQDAETYAHETRAVVDTAINELIGRPS
jgi:hypothetical protein